MQIFVKRTARNEKIYVKTLKPSWTFFFHFFLSFSFILFCKKYLLIWRVVKKHWNYHAVKVSFFKGPLSKPHSVWDPALFSASQSPLPPPHNVRIHLKVVISLTFAVSPWQAWSLRGYRSQSSSLDVLIGWLYQWLVVRTTLRVERRLLMTSRSQT